MSDTLKERIRFYLIDCKTLPGKMIDLIIILLNLLVCTIFVIDTYPISDELRDLLWIIEVVTITIFTIEYLVRLYASKNRLRYFIEIYSIIDLIAILPTFMLLALSSSYGALGPVSFIRIFKVFRIFRFFRFTADADFFFGSLTPNVLRVVRLFLTILIIFFVSSGLIWQIEGPVNSSIKTFGDTFYFTVVTLTTVGFGDITPISEAGRWITVLAILSGIVLIPWQASQIVREWIYISSKVPVVCGHCGLKYHDKDASHCKSCGHIIYQEFESI